MTETVKLPYDHWSVARKLTEDLHRRGVAADSIPKEEATRLIREECAARGMHEPPTALEWNLASVWCNLLMIVDLTFGDGNDSERQGIPGGRYIDHAAGVVAKHLDYDPRSIEIGLTFLDQVRDHSRRAHYPVDAYDAEVRRTYEGYESTCEQDMLGVTTANAVKTLGPAPRHEDLHRRHWTSPLDDNVQVPDATLVARVAALVAVWQRRYHHALADASLLLKAALDACKKAATHSNIIGVSKPNAQSSNRSR